MAYFAVTIEKIKKVWKHPDADRLDLVKLEGMDFQCVVGRGDYKEGESVLYFPLDALIPDNVLDKMGLKGKLAGSKRNRVKTIRLRGELSQGLIGPLDLLKGTKPVSMFGNPPPDHWIFKPLAEMSPKVVTEYLGVTKYEPPVKQAGGYHVGKMAGLPAGLTIYDIEGADRYVEVAEEMMDKLVYISEKAEGSNWSAAYSLLDQKYYVNTRKHSLTEIEGKPSPYWDVTKKYGFFDFLSEIAKIQEAKQYVALYGEFVGPGVQGNYYNLGERDVYLFDIKIDGRYVNPRRFYELIEEFTLKHDKYPDPKIAPILGANIKLRDWLDGKTIQEASNGQSVLINKPREGIVIRPSEEEYSKILHGRLILKQRSPVYLERSD